MLRVRIESKEDGTSGLPMVSAKVLDSNASKSLRRSSARTALVWSCKSGMTDGTGL